MHLSSSTSQTNAEVAITLAMPSSAMPRRMPQAQVQQLHRYHSPSWLLLTECTSPASAARRRVASASSWVSAFIPVIWSKAPAVWLNTMQTSTGCSHGWPISACCLRQMQSVTAQALAPAMISVALS